MELAEVKADLRITHTALDANIQRTMDACMLDLETAGVDTSRQDALVDRAVCLYCRWQYDFASKGEQYRAAYTALKQALPLCSDYNGRGGHV